MTLTNAHKKIAIQKAKEQALKEMIDKINKGLALQMELVMLLVLHDKFGFGAARAKRALTEFEELWDSVNKKFLTLDDIADTVKNEIGLMIDEETLDIVSGRKRAEFDK